MQHPMSPPKKKVVQLELNEIALSNIQLLIERNKCPNFKKILGSWPHWFTRSETNYDHIEPWIQWVSAHTGKDYAEHQIFRLGDAHELKHPQIWEILSKRGLKSAIVGAMNAQRGAMEGGFFFPDPWSKKGDVYPEEWQGLWQLISRQVQGHAVSQPSVADLWGATKTLKHFTGNPSLLIDIAWQLVRQRRDPREKWRLAGYFDAFLSEIFLSLLNNPQYAFLSLFLNSVAHYQHHFWRQFEREGFDPRISCPDCAPDDDPVSFGYELMDRSLGRVLARINLEDTLVIIASGLSQVADRRHEHEGGMSYYRLNNHRDFALSLGLSPQHVFPLMSRDWQIEGLNPSEQKLWQSRLSGIRVEGHQLFNVISNTSHSLFVETCLTLRPSAAARIEFEGRDLGGFFKLMTQIAVKSGHHTDRGLLILSDPLHFNLPRPEAELPLTRLYELGLGAFHAAAH